MKITLNSLKFVAYSSDSDIYHIIITFHLQDVKVNPDFRSMTSGCIGYIHQSTSTEINPISIYTSLLTYTPCSDDDTSQLSILAVFKTSTYT